MYHELHLTIRNKQILRKRLQCAVVYQLLYILFNSCLILVGLQQQAQAQEFPIYRSKEYAPSFHHAGDTVQVKKDIL